MKKKYFSSFLILEEKKLSNFFLVFVFLMVVIFCFADISKAATTDATLFFNPSSASVNVGESFNLVSRVNPGSNTVQGVNTVQLNITFDPDVVHLSSITAASPFTLLMLPTINNTAGTASASLFIGGSQVTTTSDVATLAFQAQGAGTNSPVAYPSSADAAVNDGSGTKVVSTRTGATVTVSGDSYTVGGTASGLNGTVVLQNNGGNNLSVTSNGSFTFSTALSDGAAYDVTVLSQPTGQNCTVSNHSGTISEANVTNTNVSCENVGPWRSGGSPSGELDKDTTSATLSVTTDETATCRFSTVSGTAYDSMTGTFEGGGTTSHTYALTGLSKGSDYSYFVRCQGEEVNTDDYTISFSIDSGSNKEEIQKTKRKITTSPKAVKRGQTITESGKRFSKNSNVALYFGKYGGGYYKPVIMKTNSEGKFSLSYKIPNNKPFGTYKWYALDLKNGKRSKMSTFMVKP